MKKPISMIIAILTISCAACFAGCAKSPENNAGISNGNRQRITVTDDETPKNDNTDGENPTDRDCPDGHCKRRGPHAGHGRKHIMPIGENFTFIIEINPDFRHGKCRPAQDKPEDSETAPSPDNGENDTNN